MSIARPFQLVAVALALGACATTGPRRGALEPGLYGIAGDRLASVGNAATFEASEPINDVGAMTWSPSDRRFYAIADASSKPRLISVDPKSGEATSIGPIESPGLKITLAEGLAVDPRDGTLYAAGGASTFASNVLFTVDPATGAAQQVARIRGTIQDEIDAMAFAHDVLYAVDGAGNTSELYRINLATGKASRASEPFAMTVTDLAFDPTRHRLFGARGADAPPLTISVDNGDVEEMPAASGALNAVAIIPTTGGASLFEDGFESGDASAWTRRDP